MAIAVEHPARSVRVHETPYELRVEIELPEGEPQLMFAVTKRGLEIRVFRPYKPYEPDGTWHSNPDAVPT
jgi:hypothetical protein